MKLQSKGAPWGPCGLFWLLCLSLWSKDRPFTMSCWPLTWMPRQSQAGFLSSFLPVTSKSWGWHKVVPKPKGTRRKQAQRASAISVHNLAEKKGTRGRKATTCGSGN